ncbi:PadR family transcriptional regulator [Salimicrobium jeotgali]|uniref:PadR family transcriptional regulator n=1 Tax=Salimicrobium jeotgali TaxID=1230341 RepID=K2G9P8_9BACI|nr:PadR family transcriptional regulator [Salimicrobium jeotgali]AKG05447.1 PadR family transcriptional regulator [Salimicrobium jeotgali]EKE31087.1 PadR family transcriptional regulator [Salimicrobium jeotgali]MBM7697354.1 PadR family transcriptional regulator PadR [Salimicrobium jeotgali]
MNIGKETLKGNIDIIILSLLKEKDMYGYEIAKLVRDKSQNQFEIKEATLYLSLKRLSKNNLVVAYWSQVQGSGPRRKYYKITSEGANSLMEKVSEWNFFKNIIETFLATDRGDSSAGSK